MSAPVTTGHGRRHRVERAWRFAREAGFETRPCRPRSPETKGKDESADRFLARPMAYEGDFDGEEDLMGTIGRTGARRDAEPNGTTGLPLVRAAGREWSVPRRCIGRRAKLLLMPGGQLVAGVAGRVVATHDTTVADRPLDCQEGHYVEAIAGKGRYGDQDIEEAARANLAPLDRLGAAGGDR